MGDNVTLLRVLFFLSITPFRSMLTVSVFGRRTAAHKSAKKGNAFASSVLQTHIFVDTCSRRHYKLREIVSRRGTSKEMAPIGADTAAILRPVQPPRRQRMAQRQRSTPEMQPPRRPRQSQRRGVQLLHSSSGRGGSDGGGGGGSDGDHCGDASWSSSHSRVAKARVAAATASSKAAPRAAS